MNNLFNLDIERGILVAIIFDGEFDKIKNILKAKDFYLPNHQNIFEAMETLYKKDYPIDEVMIKEELEKQNKYNENCEVTMNEIIVTAPIINVEVYAKQVKEYSTKRKIEHFSNVIKQDVYDDTNSSKLIENLKKDLDRLNNENNFNPFQFKNFKNVENKEIEFILKDFLPIPKKAVTLLSARGGAGKSWLVLQLALRYINQNPDKKVFAWLSEDPDFGTKKRAEKILDEVISGKNIDNPIYNNFSYLGSETRPFHFLEQGKQGNQVNNLFYQFKNSLKDYEFIILDPLIAFYGGNENDNSQAREFMNLLTEWADLEDKAILVVHHNNKGKNESGGIRGASAFVDAVRLQYELKLIEDKKDEDNPNTTITSPSRRKIGVIKDNWGVERILGGKEKGIKIFGDDMEVNVIEYNSNRFVRTSDLI